MDAFIFFILISLVLMWAYYQARLNQAGPILHIAPSPAPIRAQLTSYQAQLQQHAQPQPQALNQTAQPQPHLAHLAPTSLAQPKSENQTQPQAQPPHQPQAQVPHQPQSQAQSSNKLGTLATFEVKNAQAQAQALAQAQVQAQAQVKAPQKNSAACGLDLPTPDYTSLDATNFKAQPLSLTPCGVHRPSLTNAACWQATSFTNQSDELPAYTHSTLILKSDSKIGQDLGQCYEPWTGLKPGQRPTNIDPQAVASYTRQTPIEPKVTATDGSKYPKTEKAEAKAWTEPGTGAGSGAWAETKAGLGAESEAGTGTGTITGIGTTTCKGDVSRTWAGAEIKTEAGDEAEAWDEAEAGAEDGTWAEARTAYTAKAAGGDTADSAADYAAEDDPDWMGTELNDADEWRFDGNGRNGCNGQNWQDGQWSKQYEPNGRIVSELQGFHRELYAFKEILNFATTQNQMRTQELLKELYAMRSLNQNLTQQTRELTHALRKSATPQGLWGELSLERLLEFAGLIKGIHYAPQVWQSDKSYNYRRIDFIVYLPNQHGILIDAKCSLSAYTELMSLTHNAPEDYLSNLCSSFAQSTYEQNTTKQNTSKQNASTQNLHMTQTSEQYAHRPNMSEQKPDAHPPHEQMAYASGAWHEQNNSHTPSATVTALSAEFSASSAKLASSTASAEQPGLGEKLELNCNDLILEAQSNHCYSAQTTPTLQTSTRLQTSTISEFHAASTSYAWDTALKSAKTNAGLKDENDTANTAKAMMQEVTAPAPEDGAGAQTLYPAKDVDECTTEDKAGYAADED